MKRALIMGFAILFGVVFHMGAPMDIVSAKTRFVTFGTGGVTGVYYPTGGAIARIVNKKREKYGIRCTVESTGGSVFNINAVVTGDLEFGIVQSDQQYNAYNGVEKWKDKGPQRELRAVFSIHPENVDLLVAVDAKIDSIADLKGKRVNIGNIGSGSRQNAIDALNANGLNHETDFLAESIKPAEAPGLLQEGRLDAIFYTVGHPSDYYKEATDGARKVKFIPIQNIEDLLKKHTYYARSVTLIENYPNAANEKDIPTFGVKATLCTSSNIEKDIVYAITREIFENLDKFKTLHPAYKVLTREGMLEGLSAPIHEGAMKYYKEVGLK
ncbi:MAG: TAXI family TRAP transporter solute-binding subunit [Desulfobacterales bacterium]|nr:TAXI family TRAP transporter solute-binding subunit [Desulfobacterales bacterium]